MRKILDSEIEVQMGYISEKELAQKCKDGTTVALVSRDDEENTHCTVEICKDINEETIIYFLLKEIVKEKQSISQIKLIAIDYLLLLSSDVEYETRKTEIEANVRDA